MTIRAGAKLDATDWDLPDVVTAFGNGSNTVTSTSFGDLPTTTCIAAITNPHPGATMLTLVEFGARMSASANSIIICPRISGSTTIAAGIGGGGAIGWGDMPYCETTTKNGFRGSFTVELPVSGNPATFTMQAFRGAASGTQIVEFPTIRLIPLRFVF